MARGTMLRTTAKPWVSRKIDVTQSLQVIYFWNQRKILSKIAFLDFSVGTKNFSPFFPSMARGTMLRTTAKP